MFTVGVFLRSISTRATETRINVDASPGIRNTCGHWGTYLVNIAIPGREGRVRPGLQTWRVPVLGGYPDPFRTAVPCWGQST